MKANPGPKRPQKPLDWQHGIFGNKIPTSLSKISRVGLLWRGLTLWSIWVESNDLTSNKTRWDVENTQ